MSLNLLGGLHHKLLNPHHPFHQLIITLLCLLNIILDIPQKIAHNVLLEIPEPLQIAQHELIGPALHILQHRRPIHDALPHRRPIEVLVVQSLADAGLAEGVAATEQDRLVRLGVEVLGADEAG
jgi:hypothetical protein